MSRRIFLDVGAHTGETLEEALRSCWAFDALFAFEPVMRNVHVLRELNEPKLTIVPVGWWAKDAVLPIHDPGAIGASIHSQKAQTANVELCEFIDAAAWLENNTRAGDEVWLKMNCEGAECEVLESLAEAGLLSRIDHLLVHFDVEKIVGLAPAATRTRATLRRHGVEFLEGDEILFGRSHSAKTANWLAWTTAGRWGKFVRRYPVKWEYRVRQRLYPVKVRFANRT